MAESWSAVWIPAFATAHVLGLLLMLYAMEQLSGALTYYSWLLKYKLYYKKKFQGNFKLAWYYTYPGAKEAHDAQVAAEAGTAPAAKAKGAADIEEGVDKVADGNGVHLEAGPGGNDRQGQDYPMPVELAWKDVSYRVKVGNPPMPKTVLHKSSGSFKPCEAIALMGPSGAGKSTMLDILAGRRFGKGVKGSVTINGDQITPDTASKFASYVGQEDVFVASLSVWEALHFYTQLSLPGRFTPNQRKGRMESVLETMGLLRVKNSKVGGLLPGGVAVRGISGGEKRRLSIACGLVANPSVLFLDEPTTGLDSHAALAVMNHLIHLTDYGLTIVASIHQPRQEIYEAFDKVMILSEGYLMFLAPPAYALHWFKNVMEFPYDIDIDGTVADWLISTVSVTFYKSKDAAARSLSSVEEVKAAAKKFAALQEEAEREAEEKNQDILDTARSGTSHISTTGQYKWIMNTWLLNSTANLLTTRDKVDSAQPTPAQPSGQNMHTMDTMETLPADFEISDRKYPRRWVIQYWLLWKRAFFATLRNPAECAIRLLMSTWVSMFAGLVYIRLADNAETASPRLATLFFSTMLFLMNPFSYMSFFLADRRFFLLDSANGLYAPSAYHLAAVTASAPFVVLNTCAGGLTFYGLCALRYQWDSILIAISIMSLHALIAHQFAIWCVWANQTQDAAFGMAASYVSFSLLLCGFYVRVADMRLSIMKGLTWVSFSKYTLEALAHNELQDRVWDTASCDEPYPIPLSGGAIPDCDTSGNAILEYYGMHLTIAQTAACLLGFYGLFNLLSYRSLLRMYRKRK